MAPVFAHGRLRLYLLKLLDEAPRHGYEVIRLLEERFQGLYAPSAGTVYPRLAKLEAEGLVTHTTEGGRKVYAITDAGRAELADRSGELAELELEIRESVAELAAEIRDNVRGAAGDLRRDMRAAAAEARAGTGKGRTNGSGRGRGTAEDSPGAADFFDASWGDTEAWREAKEEFKRAKQEWKEQARRAKDESRRAREEAQRARRQAKEAQERAQTEAQEELQRIARQVQEQVQDHFTRGDWPTGVREGLSELAREFGDFGKMLSKEFGTEPTVDASAGGTSHDGPADTESPTTTTADSPGKTGTRPSTRPGTTPAEEPHITPGDDEDFRLAYDPAWAHEPPSGNPARDLDRLLDRFRDDIRDAARDHGVTTDQLKEARRNLSSAAAHMVASLKGAHSSGS
ncbi:helix-turn-helix transcriptional regulator [Streptomyces sp. NA04227]|uniref:helix-turn-helix transcriptional regulator n=1 Tax=Streptomyces sp. NA04227 TaxID=2742136 RepID=UPI00159192B0|nr:helix-turn-helix transcriptional regulator [Streptomyces sp. NA04227]QKW09127.1 helix-turn-helix transcriptional regulator [Streptomyces sp. NA04227]